MGNSDLEGTGVHTISNIYFKGADHISPTAISTARNHLGYKGSDEDFDFGYVYGSHYASPSRREFTQAHLRELAKDHKLTKADLMETLSNPKVDFHGTRELSASSMVSDFTLDG